MSRVRKDGLTKPFDMDTHIYDFQIRILLSKDEGNFVAHALEMDLVAYGKTEKEAVKELDSMIENQMSFAIERGDDRLMLFPAPKEFFEQWEQAHADALKGIAGNTSAKRQVRAVVRCLSKEE